MKKAGGRSFLGVWGLDRQIASKLGEVDLQISNCLTTRIFDPQVKKSASACVEADTLQAILPGTPYKIELPGLSCFPSNAIFSLVSTIEGK
jgi:hypothetical protein